MSYKETLPVWWSIFWRFSLVWMVFSTLIGFVFIWNSGFWQMEVWETGNLQEIKERSEAILNSLMFTVVSPVLDLVLVVLVSLWAVRVGLKKHDLQR
jgi:ABC-type Fe3+ transport system permease subunit